MSLRNYKIMMIIIMIIMIIILLLLLIIIIIIINTVTGPSLGHRYVITAINEQKKVKRNRIIFVTCDADKKRKKQYYHITS